MAASPVSASRSMPGSSSELLDHPHEIITVPCCINVAFLHGVQKLPPQRGEGGVQCIGLGLFPSIFRLISLTWARQGLVILVISSTRGSIVAASGQPNNAERKLKKKKKGCSHDPPPCSHHRGMTRSAQGGSHKQVSYEWCGGFTQAP